MSQPPHPPQSPSPVGRPQPPAAPTQVGFLNQAPPVVPQPQSGPFAVGFPNYRSPAPSPPNRTSLIVGTIVVLATVVFAVVGFLIVGGRGANSPEGAVEGLFSSLADGDSGRAHDLLCDELQAQISENDLMSPSGPLAGAQQPSIEVGDATDVPGAGGDVVSVPYTVNDGLGNVQSGTATVVEDKGWRVCGFSG